MNRLRILLIVTALMTGGSALASAQVYEHGEKAYRSIGRDRGEDRDLYFKKGYDRDDRYRSFDNDRDKRDRDSRKKDRDNYQKYERRDNDRNRR